MGLNPASAKSPARSTVTIFHLKLVTKSFWSGIQVTNPCHYLVCTCRRWWHVFTIIAALLFLELRFPNRWRYLKILCQRCVFRTWKMTQCCVIHNTQATLELFPRGNHNANTQWEKPTGIREFLWQIYEIPLWIQNLNIFVCSQPKYAIAVLNLPEVRH